MVAANRRRWTVRRPIWFVIVLAVMLEVTGARAEAASFHGLGDLLGGDFYSVARAVSADGSTVVGASQPADAYREAFRWTLPGGMQPLGHLPGADFLSEAYAVSSDDLVVVGDSRSDLSGGAFRWTQAEGMTGLGDLPGGTPDFPSRATGASADGSVIVGTGNYSAGGGPSPVTGEAFRRTVSGGMVGLGDVPGGTGVSRAFDVSADGSVIVGKGNAEASFQVEDLGVAFRWTSGEGMVSLGFLPGGSELSAATAVSANGSVVVGYSRSGAAVEAFHWTAAKKMVGLGYLNLVPHWNESHASGVSGDGSVVVGGSDGAAFLWTAEGGMRRLEKVLTDDFGLDPAGWALQEATGVSDDGNTVVGWGQNPAGQTEAWRAHLPPHEQLNLSDPPGGLGTLSRPFALTGGARSLSLDMTYASGGNLVVGLVSAEDLESAAQQALKDYMAVGLFPQIWDASFSGDLAGADLVFHYDDNALRGIDESSLTIWHFTGAAWVMGGSVNEEANTISLSVDAFSPFSLGVVPEPSTLGLLAAGALVWLACAGRRLVP